MPSSFIIDPYIYYYIKGLHHYITMDPIPWFPKYKGLWSKTIQLLQYYMIFKKVRGFPMKLLYCVVFVFLRCFATWSTSYFKTSFVLRTPQNSESLPKIWPSWVAPNMPPTLTCDSSRVTQLIYL